MLYERVKRRSPREKFLAQAAKLNQIALKEDRKERKAKEEEDQYWREAEGPKSRATKKHEEQSEKQAEAAAKKAEARRLAMLEQAELDRSMKTYNIVGKVTEAELLERKEAELRKMEEQKKRGRVMDEVQYSRMVDVENMNRDGIENIDARSVESVIRKMVAGPNKKTGHNALFTAYKESVLPRLEAEKPGLTQNQYLVMVCKLWNKSPKNPENQRLNTELRVNMQYQSIRSMKGAVPQAKEGRKTEVKGPAIADNDIHKPAPEEEKVQTRVRNFDKETALQYRPTKSQVTLGDYLSVV